MGEAVGKLAAKLLRVVKATSGVPKTGWNAYHRYHYTTEEDLIAALRKPLTEAGLAVFFSCDGAPTDTERSTKNGTTVVTTVPVRFTVIDSESGESMTGVVYGRGEDPTDKGVYKAYTGAQKYFLQKLFMLSTGDDPERDSEATETPKPAAKESKPAAKPKALEPDPNRMADKPTLDLIYELVWRREIDDETSAEIAVAMANGMTLGQAQETIAWLRTQPKKGEAVNA